MRLIDADALQERISQVVQDGSRYSFVTLQNVLGCIDQAPTVGLSDKQRMHIYLLHSAAREVCEEPGTGRAVLNMTEKSAREFLQGCAYLMGNRE